MARPALTDEQRRETRRAIRRAAARLYAEKGIGQVSARAIADAAGVSVGTLYSYFDNLTALMQSLWKEPVARFIADAEAKLAETHDPRERLRVMLDLYAAFARDQREVYRGAFLYVRPQSHDKPSKVALTDDRFFGLFRSVIATAQAEGVVRPGDPTRLAETVWAGLHGAVALPTNFDRLALDDADTIIADMIDAMLEWLTP